MGIARNLPSSRVKYVVGVVEVSLSIYWTASIESDTGCLLHQALLEFNKAATLKLVEASVTTSVPRLLGLSLTIVDAADYRRQRIRPKRTS